MFIDPVSLPFVNDTFIIATIIWAAVVLVVASIVYIVSHDWEDSAFSLIFTIFLGGALLLLASSNIHSSEQRFLQLETYTHELAELGYEDPTLTEDWNFTASLNGEYVRGALVADGGKLAVLTITGPEIKE